MEEAYNSDRDLENALFSEEELPAGEEFSWQASEYVYHQKQASWYFTMAGVFIVLIVAAVLTRQWLTIGVFAVMAAALMVYAAKKPRILNYHIDDEGLTVQDKHYPYESFRSFGVIRDIGWQSIELEPTKRFMPRLSILFDNDHANEIVGILSQYLPRQDREPDFIEKLTRRLKF